MQGCEELPKTRANKLLSSKSFKKHPDTSQKSRDQ